MNRALLIVEDDRDIRASLSELFTSEGYEVITASHGNEALTVLRSRDALPKLILLDLMMPDMDGYQFRAVQAADARLAPIPVLLMSAGGELNDKAKSLGVAGHLRKPFADLESLLAAVARYY